MAHRPHRPLRAHAFRRASPTSTSILSVRKHQPAVILFVVNGFPISTRSISRGKSLGRQSACNTIPTIRLLAMPAAARPTAVRSLKPRLCSGTSRCSASRQPGQPVPDEGANATALACGKRVENGFVAADQSGDSPPVAHLRRAESQARHGPRHHQLARAAHAGGVLSRRRKGAPRIPTATRRTWFTPRSTSSSAAASNTSPPPPPPTNGAALDNQDLLAAAKARGYTVIRSREELNNFYPAWLTPKLFGVFAPDQFYYSSLQPQSRRQPSLAEMTRVAISGLKQCKSRRLLPRRGARSRGARRGEKFRPARRQ